MLVAMGVARNRSHSSRPQGDPIPPMQSGARALKLPGTATDRGNVPLGDASRSEARAQLLEAASVLMRERDSLDISILDIALRANRNSALIKYYFGSKEGLLRALLERDVGPQTFLMAKLMASSMSPSSKLRTHIKGLVNLYFTYPYLNRLLMRLMREATPQTSQEIADVLLKPLTDAYARLLEAGVTAGEFRPMDPKLFYFNIIGACDPFFSARIVLRYCYGIDGVDDRMRQDYLDQTTEMILRGVTIPLE